MIVTIEKAKKNSFRVGQREHNLPVGVSMLTLSGFRICQMRSTQLNQVALLKRKLSR